MATPIRITNPDDARLMPFRDIRERDLVGRQGHFIAEGEVVLRMLLEHSHFGIETILLSRRRAEHMSAWVEGVHARIPVLVAEDDIIASVAGFALHRGVLAMGLRGASHTHDKLIGGVGANATVLVCVGIANHDNMGGLFRNAAAFGVDAVLLDQTCCDPLYRKAIRVSVGGVLSVPFSQDGHGGEIIAALQSAGFQTLALTPGATLDMKKISRAPRTALIVGAEGTGLSPALLTCMTPVRIAMAQGFDSLNVATAAAIALYSLSDKHL